MKYHVKVTGVKTRDPLEDDFDFAEINVVKEVAILVKKINGYQVIQYSIPLNEIAEISIVPYEDNESQIPSC